MMAHLRVSIEEGSTEEPPVAAWVLDLPGAYATGRTREEALEGVVGEVRDYWRWLRKHGETAPPDDEPLEVEVVETFQMFRSSPEYEVNAFFAPDALKITDEEIPLGRLLSDDPLVMLEEARAVAAEHLRHLEAAQRERVTVHAGEKWSARKVLRRFLYHERYHTKSVRRILQAYRQVHG